MEGLLLIGMSLLIFLIALLISLLLVAKIHGIIISFKKKWYMGVVALLVPGFAIVVSVAKVVFKKDFLR